MQIGAWRVVWAADAPRTALTRLLRELGDPDPADAVVVKRSRVRRVLRVALEDGSRVYLKRDPARGGSERWRALVGRSRAMQEFVNLQRLGVLEVPAVAPLACAERREGPWLREALLATREVPGAAVLRDVLRRDAGPALLLELAHHMRRLHDSGCWHRDLHAGNVLVEARGGRPAICFVDVQKLRRLPLSLPRGLRHRDLGMLHYDLARLVDDATRARVLEAYARSGTPELDVGRLRARVERACARRARRRLRSRERRCVRPSTGFRIERRGRYRIYRRADLPHDSVLAALEAHRRAMAPGLVGSPQARRATLVAGVLGGPPPGPAPRPFDRGQGAPEPGSPARGAVLVREEPGRGLAEILLRPLGRHAGMRAWRAAHAQLLRGIDQPAPLALVEERHHGRVVRSYLLARDAPGAEDPASSSSE